MGTDFKFAAVLGVDTVAVLQHLAVPVLSSPVRGLLKSTLIHDIVATSEPAGETVTARSDLFPSGC